MDSDEGVVNSLTSYLKQTHLAACAPTLTGVICFTTIFCVNCAKLMVNIHVTCAICKEAKYMD